METKLSNCFFAVFDIIGFANLVKTKGTEELFKYFNKSVLLATQYAAVDSFMDQERNGRIISVPDLNKKRVQYQIFSDTIIFYTKDDSWKSYFDIIVAAIKLMTFSFVDSAPFRGAIGYGDLMANDNNVILGSSFIDAHQGEQSQVWSGCILTKNCEDFCKKMGYFEIYDGAFSKGISEHTAENEIANRKKMKTAVVKYDVPKQRKLSNSEIEYYNEIHYVINWTHWVSESRQIEESFQQSNKPHHEKIKNNTVVFNKWARSTFKIH